MVLFITLIEKKEKKPLIYDAIKDKTAIANQENIFNIKGKNLKSAKSYDVYMVNLDDKETSCKIKSKADEYFSI